MINARDRRGYLVPVVVLALVVAYVVMLAASLRREDISLLTDRAEARLALAGHLASAADECWWQLTAGKQGEAFQTLFRDTAVDPLAFSARFEPDLTRASVPADDATTLSAAQVDISTWQAAGAVPQGLVHLKVTGRASIRRGRAALALHQLRRFWVYTLTVGGVTRYTTGAMVTREIVAQWVEEV